MGRSLVNPIYSMYKVIFVKTDLRKKITMIIKHAAYIFLSRHVNQFTWRNPIKPLEQRNILSRDGGNTDERNDYRVQQYGSF